MKRVCKEVECKRYWQFYDWEKDLSGDLSRALAGECGPTSNVYEAPLNLFAVLAFESAARCAEAVGEALDAVRWRQAADAIRSTRTSGVIVLAILQRQGVADLI